MSNHVINKIEFFGAEENIKKVMDKIKGDSEYPVIDFRKIIPVPENIFQGSLGPEEREKYGENNWYDWNIGNWGTKWNAYEENCEDDIIIFLTAWSKPTPILQELATICSEYNVTFEGSWCNEDYSTDSGTFDSQDGEVCFYPDNSYEEHLERYVDLWQSDE